MPSRREYVRLPKAARWDDSPQRDTVADIVAELRREESQRRGVGLTDMGLWRSPYQKKPTHQKNPT